MIRFTIGRALGACGALAALMTSVAALAANWTPEGAQHWVEVAHRLNAAANADEEAMGAACKGVTLFGGGSEVRQESSNGPSWASKAHFEICLGYQSYAGHRHGHSFHQSNDPCRDIKNGIGELSHATAGSDPQEVVAAANQLSATLQTLVSEMKDAKSCKFKRTGLF